MIPTLVAGLIGLAILIRIKPRPEVAPARVRVDRRPARPRRRR